MKKPLLLLILLTLSQSLSAQLRHEISFNNIRTGFYCDGIMFWNRVNGPAYEFPKVTGTQTRKHTMFSAGLWIGGLDENGVLYLSADQYQQRKRRDYWAGPIGDSISPWDSRSCQDLEISKWEIDDIKTNPSNGSIYRTWPAHGDTTNGEAFHLAPFVDLNNNGIYETDSGDYPDIRGDQARYFIYNDMGPRNRESGPNRMGLEIHYMPYAYASNDDAIDNTIFVHYVIHNRSNRSYHDVHIGLWADFNIGYAYDDYIGSDTTLNAFYGYNGDNLDDGVNGYGNNPPAQAAVLLNKPMTSFISYNNDFSATGIPDTAVKNYNYIRGRWMDGTPITIGGNGRGGSQTTKFQYPGDPAKSSEWSEVSANTTKGDRKGIGSYGPINLEPGGKVVFDVAYVTAQLENGNGLTNVAELKKHIQAVQDFYDGQNYYVSVKKNRAENVIGVQVYPNPSEGIFNAGIKNGKASFVQVYNMQGKLVQAFTPKTSEFKVDLSCAPKGIYLMHITTENGAVTRKLVLE